MLEDPPISKLQLLPLKLPSQNVWNQIERCLLVITSSRHDSPRSAQGVSGRRRSGGAALRLHDSLRSVQGVSCHCDCLRFNAARPGLTGAGQAGPSSVEARQSHWTSCLVIYSLRSIHT
ncbi:hypothetical protein J6590_035361 [Homalodisca vitripennis]|nr:hypothetical protein J6590_035361 [Homalodisca vitripennis]